MINDAQPGTVLPLKYSIIANNAKEKAASEIKLPASNATLSGLKLKEVVPFKANLSILKNEYFVLPNCLAGASKFTTVVL